MVDVHRKHAEDCAWLRTRVHVCLCGMHIQDSHVKQWFYLTGKVMTDFIFFHIRFSFSSFATLNVLTIRDLICVHLTKTWPAAHEQTDNSDLEASSYAPLSPAPNPTPPGPQSSEC